MAAYPILYSFRRCPYAIRARMAIAYAGVNVELREVVLKEKPHEMLTVSQKGTVPVLQLSDGSIIDESIDVMRWALRANDPAHWLSESSHADANNGSYNDSHTLIAENDGAFKALLDKYKYADRHPGQTAEQYRDQAGYFLDTLEQRLTHGEWLLGGDMRLADVAIFPFIRQFAAVDQEWFDQSPFPRLRSWLNKSLESDLFKSVMQKYPKWASQQAPVVFPGTA